MTKIKLGTIMMLMFLLMGSKPAVNSAIAPSVRPMSTVEEIQSHKQLLLDRLNHSKATYRGDKPGQIRIKWEWYDNIIRKYAYEKANLLSELSVGEKYELNARWVFGEAKFTFQEILKLGPEDDDKLIPILSYSALVESAPSASFEGLMLYGKQGEEKGIITRKYISSAADAPAALRVPGDRYHFIPILEYKNQKGMLEAAHGLSFDAVNLRWKDIKNRVADDMSVQKTAEDRNLLRAAFEKALKEAE